MLAILQRKGRLIDFLQEDIRAYADAQIGAAVRNVHEGCREALAEYIARAVAEKVGTSDDGRQHAGIDVPLRENPDAWATYSLEPAV